MELEEIKLKFLVLSDFHGRIESSTKLETMLSSNKFNGIILCGDIVSSSILETGRRILKTLSKGKIPIVGVPGNMDPPETTDVLNEFNANLHGAGKILLGVGFIGAGFRSGLKALLEKSLRDINEPTIATIAVTHIPPYNTKVDLAWDTLHIGSRDINEFIGKHHPTALLCGHVHESPGIDLLNNTLICNPGPIFQGYYAVLYVGRRIEAELNQLT